MNIFEKVKSLNLPLGKYAVFGSGPLMAHGLRESRDIDILTIPEVYESLKSQGGWEEKQWPSGDRYLAKEEFEIVIEWTYKNQESGEFYDSDIKNLIDEADIINGIPFVKLEEVLAWKKVRGKEKDLRDIQLIEEYLNK